MAGNLSWKFLKIFLGGPPIVRKAILTGSHVYSKEATVEVYLTRVEIVVDNKVMSEHFFSKKTTIREVKVNSQNFLRTFLDFFKKFSEISI